jgi:hypothetical protein
MSGRSGTIPLAAFAADLRALASEARFSEPFRALLNHSADTADELVAKCRAAGLAAFVPRRAIPKRPARGASDTAEVAYMVDLVALTSDILKGLPTGDGVQA